MPGDGRDLYGQTPAVWKPTAVLAVARCAHNCGPWNLGIVDWTRPCQPGLCGHLRRSAFSVSRRRGTHAKGGGSWAGSSGGAVIWKGGCSMLESVFISRPCGLWFRAGAGPAV